MKLSGLPLPCTMYERAPMLPGLIPMSPSRARTAPLRVMSTFSPVLLGHGIVMAADDHKFALIGHGFQPCRRIIVLSFAARCRQALGRLRALRLHPRQRPPLLRVQIKATDCLRAHAYETR